MFQLDLRNNKSIYDQIEDKFKEQIMMGQLQTGAKMPSVRELSRELGVNPNTCLLYTSPSPRDGLLSRMPSSA